MSGSELLAETAMTCYVGAGVCYALERGHKRLQGMARRGFFLGFALVTIFLIQRGVVEQRVPWISEYESFIFFSWTVVLMAILFLQKLNWTPVHLTVSGVACFFLGYAQWFDSSMEPLMPVLKSHWFSFHKLLGFFAIGIFVISSMAGGFYLLYPKRREDTLRSQLVITSHRTLAVGFLLLTIAIMTGVVWAHQEWGGCWMWRAEGIWFLSGWFLYAAYLHLVLRGKCGIHQASWVSIAGISCLLANRLTG